MTLKQIWCGAFGTQCDDDASAITSLDAGPSPHLARVLLYFNFTMSLHFSSQLDCGALAMGRAHRDSFSFLVGTHNFIQSIRRGLRWVERNFRLNE